MLRSVVAGFLAASIASSAFARSVTVQQYLTENKGIPKAFNELWLTGVYDGLEDANVELKQTNKAELFCTPSNLAVTGDQIKSILNNYITKHKVKMDWDIDFLLLEALKEVFPCS